MRIKYDDFNDVLTIEGVRYSGELFRALSQKGFETGQRFMYVRYPDGTFSIEKVKHRQDNRGRHWYV